MIHCHGTVATPQASTYLVRLCKHFSKKISVEYDPEDGSRGHARFPFGECRLAANESELSFNCSADDSAALEQIQEIISLHVGMFTKRSPLQVDWRTLDKSGQE